MENILHYSAKVQEFPMSVNVMRISQGKSQYLPLGVTMNTYFFARCFQRLSKKYDLLNIARL